MSTAAVHLFPVVGGELQAPTGAVRRDHLRLVEPGERRVVRTAEQARSASVHITRRGRLALSTTVALVLVLAAFSLFSALGPAQASTAIVVQPGMTLSQIAAEQLPDRPLSQAITDIQRANKLSTTSIAAGQELVIPGR